jgi:DNA (cytosine-5)-methyltransferase 1
MTHPVLDPAAATAKPPFEPLTMAHVNGAERTGLTVASTFSGAGGSCMGYKLAGFDVLWANEFVEAARACYSANLPSTHLDPHDIRTVQPRDVLEATGLAVGELDLLDGSPPCQSFSTAGRREKNWGKVTAHGDGSTQRSDDLFDEYCRLVEGLKPRAFVAENVAGLVRGVSKGYYRGVVERLRAAGYVVAARLVDAQWCGVPQRRVRVIIQGMRADLGIAPAHPAPLPWRYSIADACPWLVRMGYDGGSSRPGSGWDRTATVGADEPSPAVEAAGIFGDSLEGKNKYWVEATVEFRPHGQFSEEDAPADGPVMTVTAANHGHLKVARRVHERARRAEVDGPAPTFLADNRGFSDVEVTGHAVERRKLTIPEVKRLCSFPDDYDLAGSFTQQWSRLGNSVPPLMAARVAGAVRDALLATG